MKKRISLSILLCISLVWAVCGTAFATDTEDINTSKIIVLYDGAQIPFDVQPVLISGRTMVPFRAIFEKLGYSVGYDSSTKTVSASKATTTISMVVGSTEIHCGNTVVQSDVAPVIQSDRTLVPVRIIAEFSDCDVLWDASTQTVLIYHKQADDYAPIPSLYEPMVSDGSYLYTDAWKDENTHSTIKISLSNSAVTYLALNRANDYTIYKGKLYGRFGLSTDLSYGVYNISDGQAHDISGEDVADCYIYNDQIYYSDLWGPYGASLYKMNMDGTGKTKLMKGDDSFPIGYYMISNGYYFSYYCQSLFVMTLDSLQPIDIIELVGLDENKILVNSISVYGDYLYAAVNNYFVETDKSTPLGILKYNYKTGEHSIISLDCIAEKIIVTDNSIYYSVSTGSDINYYTAYDLYRATLNGTYPVLIAQNVCMSLWTLSGNNVFCEIPEENYKMSVHQIKTDGTQNKTFLTYSYPATT